VDAQPLICVKPGEEVDQQQSVAAFSRFYVQEFHEETLARYIARRRGMYRVGITAVTLFMLLSLSLALVAFESNLAKILLVECLILFALIVYLVKQYRDIPKNCEKSLPRYLGSHFKRAASPDLAVQEIRFFSDSIEVTVGRTEGQQKKQIRRFDAIRTVYETPDLFFFQGLTWIMKASLDSDSYQDLKSLLVENFPENRYRSIGLN
jgi:hypothetical protein